MAPDTQYASPNDGDACRGDDRSSSDPARLEASILASSTDDARALDAAGPAEDEPARTVVVVAGDADMRIYLRQCLVQVTSIRVLEAADVPRLQRIVRSAVPDLVVLDLDGDPALERVLGRHAGLNTVPLIIISDELPKEYDGVRSRQAPYSVLVKPFNSRRLCAEVHRVLSLNNTQGGSK